jgi:hypothetical protein
LQLIRGAPNRIPPYNILGVGGQGEKILTPVLYANFVNTYIGKRVWVDGEEIAIVITKTPILLKAISIYIVYTYR